MLQKICFHLIHLLRTSIILTFVVQHQLGFILSSQSLAKNEESQASFIFNKITRMFLLLKVNKTNFLEKRQRLHQLDNMDLSKREKINKFKCDNSFLLFIQVMFVQQRYLQSQKKKFSMFLQKNRYSLILLTTFAAECLIYYIFKGV